MRFSTRTRYGLRFLLRLAAQPKGELLQLSQIANNEAISPGYLEQIVRALRPLGILKATRGSGGGYALCKPPEEINLEDVIVHLEGEISPVRCLSEPCERQDVCTTRKFWQDFNSHLRVYLHSKNLRDLEASTPFMDCAKRSKKCGITLKKSRISS